MREQIDEIVTSEGLTRTTHQPTTAPDPILRNACSACGMWLVMKAPKTDGAMGTPNRTMDCNGASPTWI